MRLSDYNINHLIRLLDAGSDIHIAELRHYYYENRPSLIAVLTSFAISPTIYCTVLKPNDILTLSSLLRYKVPLVCKLF